VGVRHENWRESGSRFKRLPEPGNACAMAGFDVKILAQRTFLHVAIVQERNRAETDGFLVAGSWRKQSLKQPLWSSDTDSECDVSTDIDAASGDDSPASRPDDGDVFGLESTVSSDAKCEMEPVPAVILACPEVETRTTLVCQGLPPNLTQTAFVQFLNMNGFSNSYDFVHLPIDLNSMSTRGYALVNLRSVAEAMRLMEIFSAQGASAVAPVVEWGTLQGCNVLVERYRNSQMMFRSVPDELKPQLFLDGRCVSFPKPTRRIRNPFNSK